MEGIKRVDVEGDSFFVKKGVEGNYRVVFPWKNEDGTINWKNTISGGNWFNLLKIAFLILIILGALFEYSQNVKILLDCFSNDIKLEMCKKSFGGENLTVTINYGGELKDGKINIGGGNPLLN